MICPSVPHIVNSTKLFLKEFSAKCRVSQELIHAQIPWATAGAERSRLHAEDGANMGEVTREEQLLAELLKANEELTDALRIYDDLDRIAAERTAEIQATERSRREVRNTEVRLLEPGLPTRACLCLFANIACTGIHGWY